MKTPEGDQPIETLKAGDLVAAKNDQTGEVAYQPILQTFQNTEKPVYTLTLVDDQGQTQETLGVTDNHPFWTQEKGWVQTDELKIGDQLVLQNGSTLRVQSVILGTEKQVTYNFAVEEFRTYFVGESGVWVHNTSPCDKVTRSEDDLAKMSGQLRDAAKGKGNYGLGTATRSQADNMGRAWAGDKAKLASDGKTLVSKDGLRQYRPPTSKPNSTHARTGIQANLERRFKPEGQWQGNGHLDILD